MFLFLDGAADLAVDGITFMHSHSQLFSSSAVFTFTGRVCSLPLKIILAQRLRAKLYLFFVD